MAKFFIDLVANTPDGRAIAWNVELPFDTLEEVSEALSADDHLIVTHLWTRKTPDDPRTLTILRRERHLLTQRAIARISHPTVRFVEADEVAA